MVSHFSWLPRKSAIARASEGLILKFNPQWSAADWPGTFVPQPEWSMKDFDTKVMFYYDKEIPHEAWRGRMRSCRGVGAALPADEVANFDKAHAELLDCAFLWDGKREVFGALKSYLKDLRGRKNRKLNEGKIKFHREIAKNPAFHQLENTTRNTKSRREQEGGPL